MLCGADGVQPFVYTTVMKLLFVCMIRDFSCLVFVQDVLSGLIAHELSVDTNDRHLIPIKGAVSTCRWLYQPSSF